MGNNATRCIIVRRHDKLFRAIIQRMKATVSIDTEAECAGRMWKEVGSILKCEKFSAAIPECKQCHVIAEGRRNAVRLIMRAQKFERKMDLAPYPQRAHIMAE
jgi:hypothetical protein